jgi:hypothetical protein
MGSGFWYEAGSLLPSIGVGLLFWFAMRAIMRADRREREAEKAADAELRAAHSVGSAGSTATSTAGSVTRSESERTGD